MDTEYTSPIIEEFDDPTDTFKDNEFVYTYARGAPAPVRPLAAPPCRRASHIPLPVLQLSAVRGLLRPSSRRSKPQ